MKTIIKNKRNYRTKIGRPGNSENWDLANRKSSSSGSQQAASGIARGGDGASDAGNPEDLSNSDESSAEKDGPSAGSAGMKRKATGSGGSREKGKQRKK
jgi:hypothetical protein